MIFVLSIAFVSLVYHHILQVNPFKIQCAKQPALLYRTHNPLNARPSALRADQTPYDILRSPRHGKNAKMREQRLDLITRNIRQLLVGQLERHVGPQGLR
jgi:hypothetical protein